MTACGLVQPLQTQKRNSSEPGNDDTTSPVRPPDMMIPAQLVPLYQESFYAVITDVVTPMEALDNLDKFTKDILQ